MSWSVNCSRRRPSSEAQQTALRRPRVPRPALVAPLEHDGARAERLIDVRRALSIEGVPSEWNAGRTVDRRLAERVPGFEP